MMSVPEAAKSLPEWTDAELRATVDDKANDWDIRSEAAWEIARRQMVKDEAAHAAFHGKAYVNRGRVERRRGYRGDTVCLDCYYGKEFPG